MSKNNKNQIIVTGGVGFIGINLVKKLIKLGYFPIIIDNFSNSNIHQLKTISKNDYFLIRSDINNVRNILKKIEGIFPQTIIHLAALHYIPFCTKNPTKTKMVNVNGTKSIFEIVRKKKIRHMIFTSSGAVYKPSRKAHKEKDVLQPIDIYGKTKKEAEEFLFKECKQYRINLTILRLFNIYGKYDLTPHFIPEIIKRIEKASHIKVGNLNTERDYLYVDDLVEVFIKILKMKKNQNGIFNIGTGKAHKGIEIIELISLIAKKQIQLIENSTLKRKNDRPILCADIKKTLNVLHWKPKHNLKNGLAKLLYENSQKKK
ncbi:MAG TPA: NAD(P)-dependent oxidoreductase [Candidatus Moranbacteria bacterium]|nr:NAD(P)-dependent oxidoreductase [Candidatus Moranbacteria bacterium]HRY28113.1 NAD(P)-dependent oxidoreductase [Candidatus Moranbacteria bacterium]HSA08278.1 NAD(P)-dependent oxidoreductase [Candidatus Moranbacteria bacterium]